MSPDLPQSRAAGFVLTRRRRGRPEPEYLLLVNRRDGMPGLPKGHQDGDEDDLATARRETEEETGLVDLDVDPWYRTEIAYRVKKGGEHRWKTVVYYRARLRRGEVRLSDEHTAFSWVPLPECLRQITFDSLRRVIKSAALHAKDPGLFRYRRAREADADRFLAALPHADEALLAHLRGAARLARAFAQALLARGVRVHPEATATGTLLHDVGRALGKHEDHQLAGLEHLRKTALAPYGFACISHFTKGATARELAAAGLPPETIDRFRRAIDLDDLTWEERCAALADACLRGGERVRPKVRFADLRRRYDAPALIDLQERRTEAIREEMGRRLGRDPLHLLGGA